MKLLVKKLDEKAIIPTKKRDTDEGYDIYALKPVAIWQGQQAIVETGISAAVEDESVVTGTGMFGPERELRRYWLQIEGRSGMASKGIFPIGGIVDNGYTGEIKVILVNCGESKYHIQAGDKIAQLVPRLHLNPEVVEVDSLEESDRGDKGFNSSGN
jgi:dUTP pyrophosphatase